jgi:enoyl-CoA hydratase
MTEADALANELTHGWPIFATEDAKEGATAFKEKRKANFQGK